MSVDVTGTEKPNIDTKALAEYARQNGDVAEPAFVEEQGKVSPNAVHNAGSGIGEVSQDAHVDEPVNSVAAREQVEAILNPRSQPKPEGFVPIPTEKQHVPYDGKTMGQRLGETGQMLHTALDGATMGYSGQIAGGIAGAATWLTGNGFGTGYNATVTASTNNLKDFETKNPEAAKAAYNTGMVASLVVPGAAVVKGGVMSTRAALMSGAGAKTLAKTVPSVAIPTAAAVKAPSLLGRMGGATKAAAVGAGAYLGGKAIDGAMEIGGAMVDMAAMMAALVAIGYALGRLSGMSHEDTIGMMKDMGKGLGELTGSETVGKMASGAVGLLADNEFVKRGGDKLVGLKDSVMGPETKTAPSLGALIPRSPGMGMLGG